MNITIRKATAADVDSIFRLTNKMASRGLMLNRSKYKIVTMLQSFLVAVDAEKEAVIGCGAFGLLWTDLGEVMALAIDDDYQGKGVGKQLVNALLDEARKLMIPEVITLTYKPDFFSKLGFSVADKDKFPRKIWRECLECPKLEQCDEIMLHIMTGVNG